VSAETRFVLVDIACLECGGASRLLGFFDTVPEAQVAAHNAKNYGVVKWTVAPVDDGEWGGDGVYAIWDTETLELQALGR
jgi:hypothetical protein